MKDGHAAPDLWHLTIDDLLTPPPETPRLGGSGPFVINLSASTAPISIPTERFPGCEQLRCYQVRRTENNRWRYRLRIGLLNTELEADAILAVVREHYPSAFTATAGDDDLRAVSEASRTAQARKAHATEMITDRPDEDVETPKAVAPKAAAPKAAAAKPAAPKAAAPVVQPPQPTRWVIMQAPEKKTPPPPEPSDVDPNAVTDQVAILKLPEDEVAPELTLDDLITPPVAPPKAEVPKKAEPQKMAPPPQMAEPAKKPALRPMKEIEAELRPLFEPTRKAAPAPSAVNDLQAIADLVVIDHHDTLESVVLKNNAMVDSLVERFDVAPQAVPTVIEPVVAKSSPAAEAPTASKAADAKLVETGIDVVPELTAEIGELPIPLALAAIRAAAPPVAQPEVIEASFEPPVAQPQVIEASFEPPVLTEAVPVVTEVRTPPAAKVSARPPKAQASEPTKVVAPPVLTATVNEPPAKPVEPKKFVEFSAQTAKVIEPPTKAAAPVARVPDPPVVTARVTAPPAKVVAPVAKVAEPTKVTKPAQPVQPPVLTATVSAPPTKIVEPVAKTTETPKVIAPIKVIETARAIETGKVVETPKVVTPTNVEPSRTVKAQLVAGGAAQAIKAASKSHRAIAKEAKAAAKQSKALHRMAKAAKAHKVAAPTKDVEQNKAVVESPPKTPTPTPSALAPALKTETPAVKAATLPPKAETPAAKGVAGPPKNVVAPSKAPSASHKVAHPPKANGHAAPNGHRAPNGHAVKIKGNSREHNGHAPAPKASPPAQNGHAHAFAKPAPDHKAHSPAVNGHARPSAPAPAPTAPSIATVVAPAAAAASAAKPIEILSEPLPPVDSTQTIRALTPLELQVDEEGARWYSIQLSLSEDEVNPESVPHLDIFDEYRLYSVAGLDQGKFLHALRLGFFSDEGAAQMVAGYLKCYFDEPSVKRVSIAERERFAQRRMVASKDIGATGTHTIIELATAPPVPERTLADLSPTANRRIPEDESLLSRLFAQLKR